MAVRPLSPRVPTQRNPSVRERRSRDFSSGDFLKPKRRPTSQGPAGRPRVPPRAPIETPFQPGAPPAPPLSPIGAGLGGLVLLGQALWGLLNQRPPGGEDGNWPDQEGKRFNVPPGSTMQVQSCSRWAISATDCNTGVKSSSSGGGCGGPVETIGNVSWFRSSNMGAVSDSGACGEGAAVNGDYGLVEFFDSEDRKVGGFIPFRGSVAIGGDSAGTVTAIPDFRVYIVGTLSLIHI